MSSPSRWKAHKFAQKPKENVYGSNKRLPAADLEFILQETMSMWEEMRNRRIFITGGTGFFGRWLLESFLQINRGA